LNNTEIEKEFTDEISQDIENEKEFTENEIYSSYETDSDEENDTASTETNFFEVI